MAKAGDADAIKAKPKPAVIAFIFNVIVWSPKIVFLRPAPIARDWSRLAVSKNLVQQVVHVHACWHRGFFIPIFTHAAH
ncbi:MAG: hypothetical protein VW447_12155, partial [Limnobacter sp.]